VAEQPTSPQQPSLKPASVPASFVQQLRTLEGLGKLFALTCVGAVLFAIFIAVNRPYFDRYVREKFPAPSAAARQLADKARTGELDLKKELKNLRRFRAELYALWMTSPPAEGDTRLSLVLMAADPAYVKARLERTFATGSSAQQLRAVKLAQQAPHPQLLPVLQWALPRAKAKKRSELTAAISDALSLCQKKTQ